MPQYRNGTMWQYVVKNAATSGGVMSMPVYPWL